MAEAVIVAVARTPIARAVRGAYPAVHPVTMAGHVIEQVVHRAEVVPQDVQEVVNGTAVSRGPALGNIARHAMLRAGLPASVPAMTVTRACASGLQAIAVLANRIRLEEVLIGVASGVESISVQEAQPEGMRSESWLSVHLPDIYMPMIDTAEVVARRYGISREDQDRYALLSQQRTAAAQAAGYFDREIVPMRCDEHTLGFEKVRALTRDEGNRPNTTLAGLSALEPVRGPGFTVTAGNASQLSDGAAAVLMMSDREAARRGLRPLGVFRDYVVVGCEPDEMGIGPAIAVPALLERQRLRMQDIELYELNEAFASQAIYCIRRLGIDEARVNVNGGAIAIGHPFGMSGVRMAGHLLLEGQRRGARYGIATMCIGGGMGAAALFELTSRH